VAKDDCIFCKIRDGKIPARIVYEDDDLFAFEDIAPAAPTHILVVPKRHLVNALDLTESDDALMGAMCRTAARIARERGVADDGFRLVVNNNLRAGQSVFHLHLHLLAGRDMTWPPG
jgi:histidine triad (HIT) family protein